jgi:hypothetical protein
MENITLYKKLAALPDDLRNEVADFADFLATRRKQAPVKNKPVFGSGRGMFVLKPDFDEPLEDFKEYMA